MADEEQLDILRQGVEEWNRWRLENPKVRIDLRNTNLRETDLSKVNLIHADLRIANLSEANLSEANLRAANLSFANLRNTNLINAYLRNANLREANLFNTNLSYADLRGVNLRSANLKEANLRSANLSYAYLRSTNLREANLINSYLINADLINANLGLTQVLHTNFEGATLTGVCIQDWHINNQTNLDDVVCEYIYLGFRETERRPHDPTKTFTTGDFARLVHKYLNTVDLIFRNGIDWQAFSNSFRAIKADRIKIEGSDRTFSVRAIENLDDGSFVVRINTPKDADKAAIERSFQTKYEAELKQLEAVYRERLQAKDEQIEIYKQQSADIMELTKLAIARDVRTINIKDNEINGTSYTEELKGSGYTQKNNQVNEI